MNLLQLLEFLSISFPTPYPMDGQSLNLTEERITQLKSLFPDVVSEGKVDFDRLKAALGEHLTNPRDRYELSWAGKGEARKEVQKQTSATLLPDRESSVDFDISENIFIEGENLEALRILQKSYFGKVKMIYIDPPYNTGNDSFVYPDDYSERKEEYERRTGIKDEAGYLNKQDLWKKNTKESGQYHSVWLGMMYPRLYLSRNLLREDGVIFVSIDNHEQGNLKLLMDEIFGEENFIETITWNKRIPKNDKGIGNIHEYILVYTKNSALNHEFLMKKVGLEEINSLLLKLKNKRVPLPEAEKEIKKLYRKKDYDRGITLYNSLNEEYRLWGKINMSWPNANTFGPTYQVIHPKTKKPVKIPDRGWRWKQDSFNDAANIIEGEYKQITELHDGSLVCGRIWFDKDENTQPSSINYLDETESFLLRSVLSLKSDGGIEVEKLFDGKNYFSYPKPTSLISILLNSVSIPSDSITLDFFAGSGTTAQAVLDLNTEDGGNRKFILVQLPEATEVGSEAYKAGYRTIADISKARIQKVIAKIKEKQATQLDFKDKQQDLGFKAYRVAPSNFKVWQQDVQGAGAIATQLEVFQNPYREGTNEENMLYELMLKSGLPLTATVEEKEAEGVKYYVVNGDRVFALYGVSPALIQAVEALKPLVFVTLDKHFANQDQLMSNTQLQLREAGVEFRVI